MGNIFVGDTLAIILLINVLLFFVLHGLPLTSGMSVVNRYAILVIIISTMVIVGIVSYQFYKNSQVTKTVKHRVYQNKDAAVPERVLTLLQYYVQTSFRL